VAEWTLEFYASATGRRPVQEYLDELPAREARSLVNGLQLLQAHGLQLGLPHVRPIEQKLWELRVRAQRQHRVLYAAAGGQRFVLLHAFTKKTEQTPRREIEVALRRLSEFQVRGTL
jgi:phage-related protein